MTPELPMDEQSVARVAVIGAGDWGNNLVRNFHRLGALAAICDTCPERRRILSEAYPRYPVSGVAEQLLYDTEIHAVAIATPAETHEQLSRQAILAGKDVFVEKPLSLSTIAGRSLVDLAKTHQQILMVGHLLWYHPAILKLKQLIDRGALGRIEYIYSSRLNLGKIRSEENILWSFAPHDISVILGLLNEIPSEVHCEGGNYVHQGIADVTVSHLSFPSGVKGHIFVSWLHPFKEQKLVVVGDRQMAVFDDLEASGKLKIFPHTVTLRKQVPTANKAEAEVVTFATDEPLRAECEHFLDCIRTRSRPRTDGEEGLRVLEVLQRCQESLEQRTPIAKRPPTAPPELEPAFFTHESAFIDDDVQIGAGSKIWHVSHVMKGSRLGKHCTVGQNVVIGPQVSIGNGVKIQNNVSVCEGVTLEDHVFCGPSVVFTNVFTPRSEIHRMDEIRPTLVKHGATLGANCTIVCGVTIGRYAFVGAGSVVTRNVKDYALVYGSPARIHGWVCQCGKKLSTNDTEFKCSCGRIFPNLKDRLKSQP